MNEHPKIAVYTATRNLYDLLIPAYSSLLCNSSVDKIYLLIEDDEFPYLFPYNDMFEVINVSNQQFFRQDGPNMNSRFTYMAMMRAALCHVLPEWYDKVLSLDVDTIVNKNIDAIWDLPVEECYFAASKETHKSHDHFFYANVGVCLHNLEKMRDGKADEIIKYLNEHEITFLEQDCMNYMCQGSICEMPSCYNVNTWTENTGDWRIIHYAGIKDWADKELVKKYMERFPRIKRHGK
jgi:lipopolysaccharide biosynthesis glycosyltransferase